MSTLPVLWADNGNLLRPADGTISTGWTVQDGAILPEEVNYILNNLSAAVVRLTGAADGSERVVDIPGGAIDWRQSEPVRSVRIAAVIADPTIVGADVVKWNENGIADPPTPALDPDEVAFMQGESPQSSIIARAEVLGATLGGYLSGVTLRGVSNGLFSTSVGEASYIEVSLIDEEGTEIAGRFNVVEGVVPADTLETVCKFFTGPDDGDPIEGALVGRVDMYLFARFFGDTAEPEQLMARFSAIRLTFAAEAP